MKIFDMVQTSPEWWEIRKGIPTASEFDKILTPAHGKRSASQLPYIASLIEDYLMPLPSYFSKYGVVRGAPAMVNGQATEPEARRWYSMETGLAVQQVGFCLHDSGLFGCSPDGLVGDAGGLELKCPERRTQALYLLAGKLPHEYKCQVHGALVVSGRPWWDFLSYHPDFPQQLLVRVERDAFTDKLEDELDHFIERYLDAAKKLGVTLTKNEGEIVG